MSAEPIRKRKWDEPAEGGPPKQAKTEEGTPPVTVDAAREAAGDHSSNKVKCIMSVKVADHHARLVPSCPTGLPLDHLIIQTVVNPTSSPIPT